MKNQVQQIIGDVIEAFRADESFDADLSADSRYNWNYDKETDAFYEDDRDDCCHCCGHGNVHTYYKSVDNMVKECYEIRIYPSDLVRHFSNHTMFDWIFNNPELLRCLTRLIIDKDEVVAIIGESISIRRGNELEQMFEAFVSNHYHEYDYPAFWYNQYYEWRNDWKNDESNKDKSMHDKIQAFVEYKRNQLNLK